MARNDMPGVRIDMLPENSRHMSVASRDGIADAAAPYFKRLLARCGGFCECTLSSGRFLVSEIVAHRAHSRICADTAFWSAAIRR